ncbi:acyltransferase [Undibacterium sp. RTI2.2]|nr:MULTISPECIES: acyltransferase [unclassified Undibacterium]MDY7536866.1 acyltransferase [Undibacterium sp. 5I1]MEB0115655.1 acyltransferase [Undibacterium sp. RTI2.2]MEB0230371.1 acyltransferase [Undibacterium sp. 10I3]MEB0256748.1 acyltransferase [Undibacterium sp. 5I1]
MTSSSSRINGLDTLRAIAILLVFMYHYMVFVSHEASFGSLSQIGWAGVDLFFVLSGYLIGNQIFSAMQSGHSFSLKMFYIRRALRTLPNFYVILAVYLLFPLAVGGNPVTPLWKFLSFTQNFNLRPGSAFSHAWSLCVEEQFYLLLPAIALLVHRLRKSLKAGWILLIGLMTIAVLIRSWMWRDVGSDGGLYYVNIYYSSLCRFDELLPGVAIAMLKNFHPAAWQRTQACGRTTLLGGIGLCFFSLYLFTNYNYVDGQGFLWFTTAFGYSLLAISFALLTVAALSPVSWLYRLRIPGAAKLAIWSYALYLVHKPLMNVLINPLNSIGISVTSASGIGVMFVASLIGGWLLFTLVETPFMKLRNRFFPTNFVKRTESGNTKVLNSILIKNSRST